jgi:hypothetical protein
MSDTAPGPGWWQASDGRWYPPHQHPGYVPPPPPPSAPPRTPSPYAWAPWLAPAALPVTSALAIASLVLSILWLGGLGSLLAVIFGIVARSQIGTSQGRKRGAGLATVGLTIGLIGLAGAAGLYASLALGQTSTTPQARFRSLNVSVTEAELIHGTLQRADFPSSWSLEGGPAGIPGGVPVAAPYDDDTVATALDSCVDDRSALLEPNNRIRRVESPLFYSGVSSFVQNLVAVEPSVSTARQLLNAVDRSRDSSCVAQTLTPEWMRYVGGFPASLGPLTDPSVSLSPLNYGHLSDPNVAFTVTFSVDSGTYPLYSYEDVVVIRQGQEDALLTFFSQGYPFDLTLEHQLEEKMAVHLRALRLVYVHPTRT